MTEITESKARSLVVSGEAGYWSLHARTIVLEHDAQSVIRLQNKWFLAPASEFRIKYCGQVGVIGGRMKGGFAIEIENEEIEALARRELAERGHAVM